MVRAYIGLGSNVPAPLEARLAHWLAALEELGRRGIGLAAASGLYASQPVGGPAQRPFLNAAVAVTTGLGPRALWRQLREVEWAQGRRRGGAAGGPRPLDLDLLLYGRAALRTAELTVPHPRLRVRGFVLRPLLDLGALPPPRGRWLAHPALAGQHLRRIRLRGWPPPTVPAAPASAGD